MSDILKEIQALQEQFNNLFEVEGLGEPATEVPPSTNKLKKERKTKNGRVELVSVQDELFPYEGTKKEQFQQKVIDTINGMIQGTATLQDLLQVVRQKKAPLKEAMEILETFILERNKENKVKKNDWVKREGKKAREEAEEEGISKEPYGDNDLIWGRDVTSTVGDKLGLKKHEPKLSKKLYLGGIVELDRKLNKCAGWDHRGRDKIRNGLYLQSINKERKEQGKAPFAPLKEAMEILEAIKDDIKNHKKYHGGAATFSYKGNDYSYSPERGLKKEGKTRDDRNPIKQIVDTANKEFDDVRKYKYDLERQSRTIGKKLNKEVKKLEKTEGKGAFPGKRNDTIKKLIDTAAVNSSNRADADKYFSEINAKQKKLTNDAKGIKYEARDIYPTKKGDSYGRKPVVKASEALEEALEIMEAIINEVSIGKWKEAAASSLPKRKEEAEAAKAAAEKGWEEYDKVSREHPEDEPALYRLAQAKDEEAAKAEDKADHAYAVTRLKTRDKANASKAIKAAKKVQDKREDEFGRNPEKRTFLRSGKANQLAAADPVKSRNEAD